MSEQAPQPKRRGCLFYGCLGLIVFILVGAVGLFLAGRFALRQVERLVLQYTQTTAAPIERVEVSPAELESIQTRVRSFQDTLNAGREAKELVLTAHEINALIAAAPSLSEFRDKVFVVLEGDQARAKVSWPLPDLGPFKLQGRYLNAAIALKFEFQNGNIRLFADDVQVNGASIPATVLSRFRNENLAKNWQNDQRRADQLQKYDSIRLQDGKLILKSKAGP